MLFIVERFFSERPDFYEALVDSCNLWLARGGLLLAKPYEKWVPESRPKNVHKLGFVLTEKLTQSDGSPSGARLYGRSGTLGIGVINGLAKSIPVVRQKRTRGNLWTSFRVVEFCQCRNF